MMGNFGVWIVFSFQTDSANLSFRFLDDHALLILQAMEMPDRIHLQFQTASVHMRREEPE